MIHGVLQFYEFSGGGHNIVTIAGFVDGGKDGVRAIIIDRNGRFGTERLDKLLLPEEARDALRPNT